MIPIRDNIPSKNHSIVNTSLIGLNIIVFFVQLAQGSALNQFIYLYGLVPARYTVPQVAAYFSVNQQFFSFISFMFLHGGFLHLIGNMWSLYIFGDNVEDRLGPIRYLFFYLLCGILSGFVHLLFNASSKVPTIGASGAIAGVMGAYILLYPKSKILTLIPIFFIPWFIEIPAFFFLGVWFLLQFINATGSSGVGGGIAWWAHVGGFVFGMVFLKFFTTLPMSGVSDQVRKMTVKKASEKLQLVQTTGSQDSPHLYGTIQISPHEVLAGARKLINIPWGFHHRVFKVTIPPGIKEGSVLRLRGLGRQLPNGERSDLYLKVVVHSIYRTVN